MADIYEQHQAAFINTAAFIILKDGELCARVAIKYPRDGAGRQYAYVHWLGSPMVRGYASGGGYDKNTASVADAARKIKGGGGGSCADYMQAFLTAARQDGGQHWQRALEAAGFRVIQAV